MKIFQTIQKNYAILGISSSYQSTESKLPFGKRVLFGFLFFVCYVVLNCAYIFQVANGFIEYVECACTGSSSFIILVCLAAIAFRTTTLFNVIENIEKLIDTRCKHPKSRRFFLQTSQQVERISETVVMVVVKIALQLIVLPKCIASFATYFITDLGRDSFELPLPLWFPFDTNYPIGYLIAVIIEYTMVAYSYFMISCTLALGIGVYWFAVSTAKDIQRILHSIIHKTKSKKSKSNELKVLFAEYVHAHTVIKQVEHNFSDIFQPIIMSLLTWSLFAISATMLIIQVEILDHGNIVPTLVWILNGLFALILVFIACEIGQRINEAFQKIELTIDQFGWYLFPIKIKRMLPMIIVHAQQPVDLECFGSLACTRELFKDVIHRAYSYFMVLRQFDT